MINAVNLVSELGLHLSETKPLPLCIIVRPSYKLPTIRFIHVALTEILICVFLLSIHCVDKTYTYTKTKRGSLICWLQQCTDCRLSISQTINRLHWQIVWLMLTQ